MTDPTQDRPKVTKVEIKVSKVFGDLKTIITLWVDKEANDENFNFMPTISFGSESHAIKGIRTFSENGFKVIYTDSSASMSSPSTINKLAVQFKDNSVDRLYSFKTIS